MLQLRDTTPFESTLYMIPDRRGIDTLHTVVKATFLVGERVVPAEEQAPLLLGDEYYGDPEETSLSAATDISLMKPGTDVLLSGCAYSPPGERLRERDVGLRVGPISKVVRVFGDRTWECGLLGATITPPQPFERLPLRWERAYGGGDESPQGADGASRSVEDRNPVGSGFRTGRGRNVLDGMELPNLEDPSVPISSWKDRPVPAGFGPIAPHWQPRLGAAGTYDAAWQKERSPYLPDDFDPLYLQVAPRDQVAIDGLAGGEDVEITGATPSGELRFRLPRVRIRVTHRLDGADHVEIGRLDTVWIQAEELRLILVWRAALPCDKKSLRIEEIRIDHELEGAGP